MLCGQCLGALLVSLLGSTHALRVQPPHPWSLGHETLKLPVAKEERQHARAASPKLTAVDEAKPCLECDLHQAKYTREKYRNLRRWYEAEAAASAEPEAIGHWGITYRQYVDEFVAETADAMELRVGDTVFESAVGAGWLLRGLRELLPSSLRDTIRFAGNDILPLALALAVRGLQSSTAPPPVLCVGDSANLTTWVRGGSFDAVLCGYLQPGAMDGEDPHAWSGNWVAQMAWCAKPGGLIFIGNNHVPTLPRPGRRGGGTPESWWVESARHNTYGWDVDPDSVRVKVLGSAFLTEKWGPRYSVYMRRREVLPAAQAGS